MCHYSTRTTEAVYRPNVLRAMIGARDAVEELIRDR
jgi:hypothetical protein